MSYANLRAHRLGVLGSVAVVAVLLASCAASPTVAPETSTKVPQPTVVESDIPSSEPVAPDAPDLSGAQMEALEAETNYLSFMSFSRTGLIDQLVYEGYSKSDAAAAVDSLDVDWREQAVLKATSYLESGSFSQSGLVEQLEFEGFSRSDAEYGAAAAFGGGGGSGSGGGGTVSQQNAVESARNYLEFSAFSRTGLIEQLEYEGYSRSDATSAVDSLNVDWNEQAAKSAANYLDMMAFSRSELISQLQYEGFTASEAAYGASQAGL